MIFKNIYADNINLNSHPMKLNSSTEQNMVYFGKLPVRSI